jgi:hypothetical protein
MRTAKWTCSVLVSCALLLLVAGSCADSPTPPPGSSAAFRIDVGSGASSLVDPASARAIDTP